MGKTIVRTSLPCSHSDETSGTVPSPSFFCVPWKDSRPFVSVHGSYVTTPQPQTFVTGSASNRLAKGGCALAARFRMYAFRIHDRSASGVVLCPFETKRFVDGSVGRRSNAACVWLIIEALSLAEISLMKRKPAQSPSLIACSAASVPHHGTPKANTCSKHLA